VTIGEVVSVAVPLTTALLGVGRALAQLLQVVDRVKKLEDARLAQGERLGRIEQATDLYGGRVEELSRTVHSPRRKTTAISLPAVSRDTLPPTDKG